MNIITNESLIRRNARIGQIAMLAGLAVLLGGMYISFTSKEQFTLSIGALIAGFLLSQIGIYFSNRWGRRPRPDEILDKALKGLDNKYTIYHYNAPASHLLIGPAGLWLLFPKHQGGKITYSKGRFKQKGGNLYLKLFAQENLGRPLIEVKSEEESVIKFLGKHLEEDAIPQINAVLAFTNPKTTIEISEEENPPIEVIPIGKLKDLIRKAAKTKRLSQEKVEEIKQLFEEQQK